MPEDNSDIQVKKRGRIPAVFRSNIMAYTMVFALIGIWIILFFLTGGTFLTPRNLAMLFRQTSMIAILSLGMVLVIISGNIDLSVGSVLGLCGTVAGILQVWYKWALLPTLIVTILIGIVIGFWQGFWIAYMRVPSFIVTLAGLMIFRGVILGMTKSVMIGPMIDEFKLIGQSYLAHTVGWVIAGVAILFIIYRTITGRGSRKKYNLKLTAAYVDLLKVILISILFVGFVTIMNLYGGVPTPVLILIGLAVIVHFISTKTKFGRSVYAVGGNREATRLSGINTKKVTLFVFVLVGFLCSIVGIILTARLNAATSSAGNMMEMDTIAACVLGGASLMGGIGSIPGAICGALVMASIDNGMSLMNMEYYWQYVAKGLILIFVVCADISTKKGE
jgi:D-xylose transport system permease protein